MIQTDTVTLTRKHAQGLAIWAAIVLAADGRALRELPESFAEALEALAASVASEKIATPLGTVLTRMRRGPIVTRRTDADDDCPHSFKPNGVCMNCGRRAD